MARTFQDYMDEYSKAERTYFSESSSNKQDSLEKMLKYAILAEQTATISVDRNTARAYQAFAYMHQKNGKRAKELAEQCIRNDSEAFLARYVLFGVAEESLFSHETKIDTSSISSALVDFAVETWKVNRKAAPVVAAAKDLVSTYQRRIRTEDYGFSVWMTRIMVLEVCPFLSTVRFPEAMSIASLGYGAVDIFFDRFKTDPNGSATAVEELYETALSDRVKYKISVTKQKPIPTIVEKPMAETEDTDTSSNSSQDIPWEDVKNIALLLIAIVVVLLVLQPIFSR